MRSGCSHGVIKWWCFLQDCDRWWSLLFDGVWMLFQLERFWPVSVEDRSSLQRQKIYIVKTYFNGCTPVQGNPFLAICILRTEWILHSEDVLCHTHLAPSIISFSSVGCHILIMSLLNVPWKYCLKAEMYEVCMVDTTAHVICCSGQSGWLEENPYDVCRNLWLETQDCLSMGEHDGQLISASQEKCHVMQFFFLIFLLERGGGGSNLSSGVRTELTRITISLSWCKIIG